MNNVDKSERHVRRNAYRNFPLGCIFREKVGLWVLVEKRPSQDPHHIGSWDLEVQRLTPEEEICHEVLNS
jgi:hypothetical protein